MLCSQLSHLNKTHFHMPMQFPSPSAAIRSMKFWTWEVSLGGSASAKQPNQETDSSPLSVVHLIVGVSTLFATKVDTFPRDRESCLLLCAVSTTVSVDFENQAIFVDKDGTYFRHLELAQRWCHPDPWDLSMSGAALRNWIQPSCVTEWESEAPLMEERWRWQKKAWKWWTLMLSSV